MVFERFFGSVDFCRSCFKVPHAFLEGPGQFLSNNKFYFFQIEFLSRLLVRFMTFPLELNGNPDKRNEMLVRTSPKKIPTADMLTGACEVFVELVVSGS